MDYDKTAIATTYDAARGYRPEAMRLWLDRVAAHAPRDLKLIVDLGALLALVPAMPGRRG